MMTEAELAAEKAEVAAEVVAEKAAEKANKKARARKVLDVAQRINELQHEIDLLRAGATIHDGE